MSRCKHGQACECSTETVAFEAVAGVLTLDERVSRIERILYRLRHNPWVPPDVSLTLAEIDVIGVPSE